MPKKFAQRLALTGGVDQLLDPRFIPDDKSVITKNLYPSLAGVLEKRAAVRAVRYLGAGNISALGFHKPPAETGASYVTYWVNYASGIVSLIAYKDDGTTVVAAITFATEGGNEKIAFVNFDNECLAFIGGGFQGFYALRNVGGSPTWTKRTYAFDETGASQTQADGLSPEVAFQYAQRMVIANFGPGFEQSFTMSDLLFPSAFVPGTTYVPRAAFVGDDILSFNARRGSLPDEREPITAGIEVALRLADSPAERGFMLFTENHAYIGTGAFLESTDTPTPPDTYFGNFKLVRLTFDCGCVAPSTVVSTPYGALWCSAEDVWLMTIGGTPVRVGSNIRPVLQNCPPEARKWWHAGYHDGAYWLAVCTTVDTETSPGTGPLRTFQQWRLDLRGGPPETATEARWFGPMEYTLLNANGTDVTGYLSDFIVDGGKVVALSNATDGQMLATLSEPDGFMFDSAELLLPAAEPWEGNSVVEEGYIVRPVGYFAQNGYIYVCTSPGTTDNSEPDWAGGGVGPIADGTAEWTELRASAFGTRYMPQSNLGCHVLDQTVLFELRTKDFNFEAPYQKKNLKTLDVEVGASQPAKLKCQVIQDGGQRTESVGPSGMNDSAASNQLDAMVLDTAVLSENTHVRSLKPSDADDQLLLFYRAQLKLYDEQGYVIDASNNKIVVRGPALGNQSDDLVGEIDVGVYTMKELLDEVQPLLLELLTQACGSAVTINSLTHNRTALFNQPYLIGWTFDVTKGGIITLLPDAKVYWSGSDDRLACKRLFALMGFDTNGDNDEETLNFPLPFAPFGNLNYARWAAASVPETTAANFKLSFASVRGWLRGKMPFQDSDQ